MDGSSHAMLFDMLPAPFAGWRRRLVGRADSNEPSGPKMRSSGPCTPSSGPQRSRTAPLSASSAATSALDALTT